MAKSKPTSKPEFTPRPARGYSWPPFEKGNTKALVHGAHSERVIAAQAEVVRQEIIDTAGDEAPWIMAPVNDNALLRYCRAEARARVLSEHVLKVSAEEGAGKVPQRLWESAVASDRAASQMAEELGITPLARAKLAQTISSAERNQEGLVDLQERGKAIRERRLQAAEAIDQEDDA